MARRDWEEDQRPRFRSGFDRDPNFDRTLRAPFSEYGRAGWREARRGPEMESGSRMHFEQDQSGYGEAPLYESSRYGGSGPRSDYEFGASGGFQRFGDPYGFESSYSRTPEAYYGGESFGRAASYGTREEEGSDRRSAFGWQESDKESRRGLGPKNYARPDQRIHEDVCDALTEDPGLDASGIEVSVAGGEVTLSGTVEDRMGKRRAEDDADQVIGVRHVQNNLRVQEPLNLTRQAGSKTATPATAPETA